MKKILLVMAIIIVAITGYFGYLHFKAKPALTNQIGSQNSTSSTNTSSSFNKSKYSLTDPTSIWIIVNKQHGIPIDYTPELTVPDVKLRLSSSEEQMHINKTTAPAVKEMFDAAKLDGITLVFGSGYRSGALQQQFYNSYKAKDGQAAADTYSARPGHSEHQTGFAMDVSSVDTSCDLQICWADTQEGKWLAANAYKYGFILRYQYGKENITGYQYEPWHFRYVGKELAQQIQDSGQTLEEFFNLGAAPNYD